MNQAMACVSELAHLKEEGLDDGALEAHARDMAQGIVQARLQKLQRDAGEAVDRLTRDLMAGSAELHPRIFEGS